MLISQKGDLVTLINVFETKPEQQQEQIDQWLGSFERMKEALGLIGAALHRSTDGIRVINYAQWRSETDFDHFTKTYLRPTGERRQIAERVDPHLYEVVYLYEPAGSWWTTREGAKSMSATSVQGTVAEGFEQVCEEFAAVLAEEQAEPDA
jgi:heme-degrading monooxygenase HmoA